ncbi:deoxyribose-phosphate aldolase [Paenibacillus sp. SC116]|uniref:deoxyribose-phosphate aldolase n=1 Tax=Paenibacillus sp. SC116 TaxID=2968986 RepID=UPI00215A49ED|nr:deoxyribose-phosphate aldolase [Paenibacillus sp. SC116]MCR8845810.1 deoxyribose-phosphate aldolase [Paenibacillus sp. SC116]
MTTVNLASYIDHTFLKADTNSKQIEKLCKEALEHQFYSVCVNGVWVPACRELLSGSSVNIAAVVGFPLGANAPSAKAFEAARAVEDGATEIDMVLQIGQLIEGNHRAVEADIAAVVRMVEGKAIVKVIFETGLLNDEQKITACKLSEQAGAHFVKTSTGFGVGGAKVEDIRLMRANVSSAIGVKASGAVRDRATALAMIEAGANRIGTSSGIAIVSGGVSTAANSTAGAPEENSQY